MNSAKAEEQVSRWKGKYSPESTAARQRLSSQVWLDWPMMLLRHSHLLFLTACFSGNSLSSFFPLQAAARTKKIFSSFSDVLDGLFLFLSFCSPSSFCDVVQHTDLFQKHMICVLYSVDVWEDKQMC